MKKIFSILVCMLVINFTNAQIIKTFPKKMYAQKREIINRTTGHRGYGDVSITVDLKQMESKGETLNFTSNTPIEKVEISFVGIQNSKQTTSYNADTKTGYFYLESGAYKDGQAKGYLFHFYVKGFDKPVWVCALTEKK